MKAHVMDVLAKSNFTETRSRLMDIEDFMRYFLLAYLNECIHIFLGYYMRSIKRIYISLKKFSEYCYCIIIELCNIPFAIVEFSVVEISILYSYI